MTVFVLLIKKQHFADERETKNVFNSYMSITKLGFFSFAQFQKISYFCGLKIQKFEEA